MKERKVDKKRSEVQTEKERRWVCGRDEEREMDSNKDVM